MLVKAGREMDQIGEDIRRIGEKEQPRPGKAEETPIAPGPFIIPIRRDQGKDQREPGQDQVPDQESIPNVAGQNNPRQNQTDARNRSKNHGQHGHGPVPFESEF